MHGKVITNFASIFGRALLICFLFVSIVPLLQADNRSVEYKIKAGYLYNFTKFIDWPEDKETDQDTPFFICLLGIDPFGDVLSPIINKKIKGRAIKLLHFKEMSEDVAQCKILFISNSEKNNVKQILLELSGRSVLVVGDMENFAETGGIVGFVIRDGRVRMQINHTAALRANLNISAKLLEIAQVLEARP